MWKSDKTNPLTYDTNQSAPLAWRTKSFIAPFVDGPEPGAGIGGGGWGGDGGCI